MISLLSLFSEKNRKAATNPTIMAATTNRTNNTLPSDVEARATAVVGKGVAGVLELEVGSGFDWLCKTVWGKKLTAPASNSAKVTARIGASRIFLFSKPMMSNLSVE